MFQQLFIIGLLCWSSVTAVTRVSLAGNDWTITNNGNYTAQGFVPGSIHTILLAAKQIPDPYLGYNDVDLRFLVKQNWVFTKTFNLTSDFLASNQIAIHFEQVDTIANISINGCPVGRTNNMFLRYIFDIEKSCLKAENTLQLDFQSPVTYAAEQQAAYNETVPPDCPAGAQKGECHVNFIRKEPCSFSWDWGPAFAPIGIPRDLFLEGVNSADVVIELESVNVAAFYKNNNTWRVDVMLNSSNSQFTSQLKFVLENTTWSYETSPVFNRNLTLSLSIPDNQVARWWPNGYGNQTVYRLNVSNNGQLVGSRLIGFRTVELVQEKYDSGINGASFYFSINSQPVYVKGSNWIPSDSFQERVSDEKFERLLRSAKDANMNMLRIWGGGIYERQSFYELADELGIMLWHDFMFACSLYPVDDAFLSNVHEEIIYQVKRLQSHASIVLWSGNNENEAAVAQNWYGIPASKMNKTKDEYRKLYVDTVMKAVQEIDLGNNRPFVTSSPSNGIETIAENYVANNPQDPLYGDVHFYGYHDDSWDPTTFPITRFLSETGIQSLPSLDSWYESTTNQSELNFNSSLLFHREHSGNQLAAMLVHIEANLPVPVTSDPLKSFSYYIYLSQIHQAMTLKSISDVCRVHSSKEMIDPRSSQGHTMGLMYWQINDIWQAPTWATIEYNLKWKLSHYYVRHMYSPAYPITTLTPYLANTTDESAQVSLYLVTDLVNGVQGSLNCDVFALDSFTSRLSFGGSVSLNGTGVQRVNNVQYSVLMKRSSCTDSSQCIIHCEFNNTQYQAGQTLFLKRPKNYQLQNPNLKVQSIKQTSTTTFDVTITADRPALFVWLDTPANTTGHFSRNGFSMFESTTVVSYTSWAPISSLELRPVISLYDVTQQ